MTRFGLERELNRPLKLSHLCYDFQMENETQYKIVFYSETVKTFVKRLPKSLLAKYALARDLMVEFGPNIGGKYTKAMGKGLFELRLHASEGIARVFFCTRIGKQIVFLHGFIKKTEKTPKKELDIALNRLAEVKNVRNN